MELVEYLSLLEPEALERLLGMRPDACLEPVPADIPQLADRLSTPDSLGAALASADGDALLVGQALAALGDGAPAPTVEDFLRSDPGLVRAALGRLVDRGLAWPDGQERYQLVRALAEHWLANLGLGPSARALLPKLRVDGLRRAADGLGVEHAGLRKGQLVEAVAAALGDTERVRGIVEALPHDAHEMLDLLGSRGPETSMIMFGRSAGLSAGPEEHLLRGGLAFAVDYGPLRVPREVGLAMMSATPTNTLTGPPELATSQAPEREVRRAAAAAAHSALAAVTALLDGARETPIGALKNGGVGVRERKRLARLVNAPDPDVILWLDVAFAAGLLGEDGRRYLPTAEYDRWREQEAAQRWSALVMAWYRLEHGPTCREIDEDGTVQPPPLPLASGVGMLRRSLLRICVERGDHVSVSSALDAVAWHCPLSGYRPDQAREKAVTVVAEAERLGLAAMDEVSVLGRALPRQQETLPTVAAEVLPPPRYSVTLQSDLTATVHGDAPAAVVSLLDGAGELESRGAVRTWRFSEASVRGAFDSGLTGEELLARLADATGGSVPQPLEYLVTDVARKYGSVRVTAALCCVRGGEAQIAEISRTRGLRKLAFVELAPTVLASPKPLTEVRDALRAVGLAPIAEDTAGEQMVELRPDRRAPSEPATAHPHRAGRPPEELARALAGRRGADARPSTTAHALDELNAALSRDEVAVLADAVDSGRAVVLQYRDKNNSVTHRTVSGLRLSARWVEGWCHLRQDERVFTVAQIASVAPA